MLELFSSVQAIVDSISYNVLVFVGLMFLDIVLGLVKATKNHSLSSAIMTLGIRKKGAMMVAVTFAVLLDMLFFKTVPTFSTLITLWVIANEGLSIAENLAQLGVPIPSAITRRLQAMQVESKGEEDRVTEDN